MNSSNLYGTSPQFNSLIDSSDKIPNELTTIDYSERNTNANTTTPQLTLTPKRFVEFRRQAFEPTSCYDSPVLQTKSYATSDDILNTSNNNNQKSPFYYNTISSLYSPQQQQQQNINDLNTSSNSNPSLPTSKLQSNENTPKIKSTPIQLSNIRASSLGVTADYQPSSTSAISVTTNTFQPRSVSTNFNHFNRASYKGECRRLMSRANMETVAERAARFEEIDIERYKRMKNKLDELELIQQQQQLLNHFNKEAEIKLNQVNNNEIDLNKINKSIISANLTHLLSNLKPVSYDESKRKSLDAEGGSSGEARMNSSMLVDSIVNDYFTRNEVMMQKNNPQDDVSWKYEPYVAKYYTG